MSYDVEIKGKVKEYECFNHTSNTFEMFRLAFNCEEGLKVLYGLSKRESIKKLELAIKYFENNKNELEKLNPENGWGNYESSLELLKNTLRTLRKVNNKNVSVYVTC